MITQDSFQNFEQNLGIGTNNPMAASSYGFNPITRNRTLLEWMHRGSWLAGIAIDSVAEDMTRAGVDIKSTLSPEHITAIHQAATNFGIWNSIADTVRWARLYGGCIAVFLIDGQDPSTPLRLNTIKKDQFQGLLVLDRWIIEPSLQELVTDYGPALGLPKYYNVIQGAPALGGQRVHYSRCIRLIGDPVPYTQRLMENLWGISVLERLYDRMVGFDSATTGACQLVYKAYLRTVRVEGLRDAVAAGGDALNGVTSFFDFMRRYQGIEGLTVLDTKDEFHGETHGAFSGMADVLKQIEQQLSGGLGIPLVRLFGQSPAGFSNGEADLRNYYDTIRQKQQQNLLVSVTNLYQIIAASIGIDWPRGTQLEFRPLWQLQDTEKVGIAKSTTDTVLAAYGGGLIPRGVALRELKQSSDVTSVWSNITDELVAEADKEKTPEPEAPPKEDVLVKDEAPWIGVDFHGTLADTNTLQPLEPMVKKVKKMLESGWDVRIFTAAIQDEGQIKTWCQNVFGQVLPVTNIKSPSMVAFYDDRAYHVERNNG